MAIEHYKTIINQLSPLIISSIFYTVLMISVDCSVGDDESVDDVKLASESDTFESLISVEFSSFSLEVSSFLLSMASFEFLLLNMNKKISSLKLNCS